MPCALGKPLAMSAALLAVTASLAACGSAPAGQGDVTEGALSQAECDTRATRVREDHVRECGQARDAAVGIVAGCYADADEAYASYLKTLNDLLAATQKNLASLEGTCRRTVGTATCAQLLRDNKPALKALADESSPDLQRAARRACETARDGEMADCLHDAADLSGDTDAQRSYDRLWVQRPLKLVSWAAAYARCWWSDSAVKDYEGCSGAQAQRVYRESFSACRKECPGAVGEVCVPRSHAKSGIACGVVEKGWATRTCDCAETSACEDYDRALPQAGKACTLRGTDMGVRVVRLGVDAESGEPKVVDVCLPPAEAVQ